MEFTTRLKKYDQRPIFKQGGEESVQDSIIYHFKTRKALVFGSESQQGEMFTEGEQLKKINDSTIFVKNIRFTTSKDENPDYYLATKRAKIIPNKKIIVGPTQLVVADVPTPLLVPFAYFPLTQKQGFWHHCTKLRRFPRARIFLTKWRVLFCW